MNTCCESKLKAVLVVLKMRNNSYMKLEKKLEKEVKKNEGQVDNYDEVFAEYLTVIASWKEVKNLKDLIEMIIKEGV